jgi:SAM-dependent methyltransferase
MFIKITNNNDQYWWLVARKLIIKKVIDSFCSKNGDLEILDVGCGKGVNFQLLASYGKVYGFDSDSQSLDVAKRRTNAEVKKGDFPKNIPFQNNFDLICMLDVLEHIEDEVLALKVLRKKLKTKGNLLMTVPAYQFLWSTHDIINDHKRRYQKDKLVKLLQQNGFNILYATYYNIFLFPLAIMLALYRNLRIKKTESKLKILPLFLNIILTKIFSGERFFIPKYSLPFGVSILVFAEISV